VQVQQNGARAVMGVAEKGNDCADGGMEQRRGGGWGRGEQGGGGEAIYVVKWRVASAYIWEAARPEIASLLALPHKCATTPLVHTLDVHSFRFPAFSPIYPLLRFLQPRLLSREQSPRRSNAKRWSTKENGRPIRTQHSSRE